MQLPYVTSLQAYIIPNTLELPILLLKATSSFLQVGCKVGWYLQSNATSGRTRSTIKICILVTMWPLPSFFVCFCLTPGGLFLLFPLVLPMRWDWSELSGKHLEVLAKLNDCLSSFLPFHKLWIQENSLCLIFCQIGGNTVGVRLFLPFLFRLSSVLQTQWVSQAYFQVLGFQKCGLICASWSFCDGEWHLRLPILPLWWYHLFIFFLRQVYICFTHYFLYK